MTDRFDDERRLRRAAVTRYGLPVDAADPADPAGPDEDRERDQPADEDDNGAARRLENQSLWVDLQIRKAMERGEFDNLPGAGKPLDLPAQHDPDWWVKKLIERENIHVAPPAIGLRREDEELDGVLDREAREDGVRRVVEDFNRRVVEARRQLTGGPPVVTPTRDPEAEVEAWRARRAAVVAAARARADERAAQAARGARRPGARSPLRRLVPRRRPR